MRLNAQILLPVVTIFFVTFGCAIFADEAYQIDYHHALLGPPQSQATFFHRPSAASKASLLYTLSERHVLGAVNPKDGSIVWRQQLADRVRNETSGDLLRAGEGGDTLVTAIGETIEAWDATDGRSAWSRVADGRIESLDITEQGKDVLTVGEDGETNIVLQKLARESGTLLWEHKDSSGDIPYAVLSSGNRIFYVSLHSTLVKGFKIKVTELSDANGIPVGSPTLLSSDSDVTSKESILYIGAHSGIPVLIWADKTLKNMKINILGTKQITHVNVPTNEGKLPDLIAVHGSRSPTAKAHILVHYQGENSNWAEVYHISSQTAAKAYTLPSAEGRGAFSASSRGSEVYFTRHTLTKSKLVSSEDPTVLNEWDVRPKSQDALTFPQDITHIASEVISRGSSTYAVRSAVALSSGDWELVRNGETLWLRPEGLVGVVAAAFIEITQEESLAEQLAAEGQSDPLTAYIHRVRRHVKDLQQLPAWAEGLWRRLFGNVMAGKLDLRDHQLLRDSFGFRKLAIIATESGRLAALDVGNQGGMIWSIQAVALKPGQKWRVLSIAAEAGVTMVRGEGGEFLRVASNTGTILEHQPGGIISSLKSTVSIVNSSGDKVLVPVNQDGSLGPIPPGIDEGTIIVTQSDNNDVNGWTLGQTPKPDLLWSFAPAEGEHVRTVLTRPLHDPVASIGKALGDRNVLYKYLNINLLLITAINENASTASFYILDSTSGTLVYSVSHMGVDVSKPIVSIMSENWFAYALEAESNAVTQGASQIGREKLKSNQLIVSELYESPYPNDRGSLGSSTNSSSIYPAGQNIGDSVDAPHIITQTFLTPGPISSMSVTSTLQGITTRSVLCALPELDSIISISRAFIDPRRPVGRDPTTAEAEEGLFRYSPVLDFEPKWVISHKRDLISITNIITSPSLLESTSLVFAFGELDLFGTRTSPIGAFDMLGKGFSKLQLVLTVVALAVGTTVVAPFVRKKQIDGAWKA
ncbi:hypothetical protein ACLMJK_003124 [Lecanora helva]